jgi:hypothetical protein
VLYTSLLTNPIIWTCTAILAIVDAGLMLFALRLVSREQFHHMRWLLVVAGGVFFLGVWTSVLLWAWDWFYSYLFPPWGRYLLPPIFSAGYTLVALAMVWLSLRLPFRPAVSWVILGGVEGLLSHLYAIYILGAASKPPIMQGTNQFSVLIFAVFEKAFYWGLILLACRIIWQMVHPQRSKSVVVSDTGH